MLNEAWRKLRDNDDSIQRGSEGENNFVKVASTKGYKVHKSSKTEDIHGHIDYWLENEKGDRKSVDVKGKRETEVTLNLVRTGFGLNLKTQGKMAG